MDTNIPVIVISEYANTREVLKLYLNELNLFSDYLFANDLLNAYELVRKNPKSLLIIDISEYPDPGLNFLNKIKDEFLDCKIIALSDKPSVDLMIKIMRCGVRKFLSLPIIKNEFSDLVSNLWDEFCGNAGKVGKGRIITVYSNKGGIGKTSVATNLALELAKITKENVVLVDLNFHSGDITAFLDLKPSFNISYMLQNLDKINKDFLLSTIEKYKDTSLYVLADPPYFKQADNISADKILTLLEILRDTFSYAVVDISAVAEEKTISALKISDLILLVCIANLPALRNSQRCLEFFNHSGIDTDKVQILINRFMENDDIKSDDIENLLGKKIFAKIPNNYFTLMSAINKGLPVCDINPASNVAKSYRELAIIISDNIYKRNMMKLSADG